MEGPSDGLHGRTYNSEDRHFQCFGADIGLLAV